MSGDITPELVDTKIESHEKVCAERYAGINEKISDLKGHLGEIKRILAWAAVTIFMMFVGVLGWSLQQQYAAQQASQQATTAQLQLLQSRISAAPAPIASQPPSTIP